LILGFFLFTAAAAPALPGPETSPAAHSWKFGGFYLKKAGSDFKDIFTAPGRWRKGDWAAFAALAGTGALLYVFDQEIYDSVQARKTAGSEDASAIISKFGNSGYLAALMTVMYASGEVFDSRPLRRTALLCLESYLATEAFVWAGKILFGRARPIAHEGASNFHPFTFKNAHHSFPSGDASGAFAVATVIAAETESPILDALAYGLAGLAAFWRVHDRKHWPSDVFIASALGFVVGKKVVSLNGEGEGSVRVSVQANSQRRAVSLAFVF
jgi:membrane-associated phospholipid phosphatase